MSAISRVVGAVAVATMLSSSAFAAPVGASLAPGKPAGVQKAQVSDGALIIGGVAVAVVATVAAVVASQSGDKSQAIAPGTTITTATH